MILSLGTVTALFSAVKVVKLKRQSPVFLAATLRQLFDGRVRIAEAPMINGLVIHAETNELMDEVSNVIRELDRPASMLRFSVQALNQEQSRIFSHDLNAHEHRLSPHASITRLQSSGSEVRTVVGMEGFPCHLTDQTTRVLPMATPWGPDATTITQTRGLQISGRRSGPGVVTVEVFYASGKDLSTREILTQVQVPVGQWVDLGALSGANNSRSGGTTIGAGGIQTNGQKRNDLQRNHYLVKVEIAR